MLYTLNAYTLSECMEIMADKIAEFERDNQKNIIFCEDRLTLIAERALTRKLGGSFLTSVTTFARVLNTDEKILSKQGSVMAIGRIMSDLQREKKLHCFTSAGAIENSARCIYETIAQIAASEVTPDVLKESSELLDGDVLKDKVCDLELIYREYSAFLSENGYLDESKYLSLLPDRIRADKQIKNANVFFLCYTSFTAQAQEAIRAAIETAKNVVGIFCAGEEDIYTNRATVAFQRVCAEYGKSIVRSLGTAMEGDAELLRQGLFNLDKVVGVQRQTENVHIYEAKDVAEEAERVATQIKKCLAENPTAKYRDFAVLIPDAKTYALSLKKAFSEYGIPYFFDEKKSLKFHPLSRFLLAVLDVIKENYSSSSVQTLCQNYFFGESDEYRNYLLKYANFRGGALKPIRENDIFDSQKTEEGRAKLLLATERFKRKNSGSAYCQGVRQLMLDFDVQNGLEKLQNSITDIALQGYLSQIFGSLSHVLDEAELLTKDNELSVTEFAGILSEGLEAAELSLIPLKTDAVFLGDITASRIEKVKYLFALGMTESVPSVGDDTALISDKEIAKLAEVKTLLEPTVAEVNLRARESVSLNLCAFTEKLYLSYPLGTDGTAPQISEIFRYVRGIFCSKNGALPVERGLSDEDFPYACSGVAPAIRRKFTEESNYFTRRADSRIRSASLSEALIELGIADPEREQIPVNISCGEELFFKNGKISPTAIEKYFECPFGNFLKNGLKIKEREETLVMAVDTGNFVHEVLERTARNIENLKTEEDAREYALTVGKELLEKPLYKAEADRASGQFSAQNLLKEGVEVAAAVYRQITQSDFKVVGVEQPVTTSEFVGKIDRVDATDRFIRIIDYKTGTIKATPVDYYTGRKLQIQTYMTAVMKDKIPAGVYYFPAHVDYSSLEDANGRYRMLGYMNGDLAALKAGDKNLTEEEKSEFFDAKLGENKRLEKVMDEQTFRDFIDYSTYVSSQARKELKEGFVAPSPYGGACEYCAFGGACSRNCEALPRTKKDVTPKKIADVVRRIKEEE